MVGQVNKTFETSCCSAVIKAGHGNLKALYVTTAACCASVQFLDFASTCCTCCAEVIATVCAQSTGMQAPYINTPFANGLTAIITGAGKVLVVFE